MKPVVIIAIAVVCSVVAVLVLVPEVPEEVPVVLTAQEQYELDVIAADKKYEAEVIAFTSSNKGYLQSLRDDCNDIYKQGLKTESYYKIDQAYLEQQACLVEWKAKVFEIGGSMEKCSWFDDWNACYWLNHNYPPAMEVYEARKAIEDKAEIDARVEKQRIIDANLEEIKRAQELLHNEKNVMGLQEPKECDKRAVVTGVDIEYFCITGYP